MDLDRRFRRLQITFVSILIVAVTGAEGLANEAKYPVLTYRLRLPKEIKVIDLSARILARYENSPYPRPYRELKAPRNCAETWRVGSDGKGQLQSWPRSRA